MTSSKRTKKTKRTTAASATAASATAASALWPLWLTEPQRRAVERYVQQRIEADRDQRNEAIRAGIEQARQGGKAWGHPPGHMAKALDAKAELLRLRAEGVSLADCAQRVGLARSTVQLLLKGIDPKPGR